MSLSYVVLISRGFWSDDNILGPRSKSNACRYVLDMHIWCEMCVSIRAKNIPRNRRKPLDFQLVILSRGDARRLRVDSETLITHLIKFNFAQFCLIIVDSSFYSACMLCSTCRGILAIVSQIMCLFKFSGCFIIHDRFPNESSYDRGG